MERYKECLKLLGDVFGEQGKTDEFITAGDAIVTDVEARIADIPEDERPSALILWKYSDGVPQVSGQGTFGTYWILASTLITASAVSMCGQVGWIGLLIPHCARMLVGSNNRYVVPVSLSLGASFMILIDTLSRTISIIELPLSILTAITGAPVFISLPNKTRSNLR